MEAGSGGSELARLEAVGLADPFDTASLAARGVLLGLLGRRDAAIEILEAAAALAPDCAATAQALGTAYMRANQLAPAAAALAQAAALAPADAGLRNNLAAVLIRLHRYREARESLETLLATHGESPGVLCNLTNALVSLGLQEAGLQAARRAIALAPHANIAWRAMGNALAYHPGVRAEALLATQRRIGATLPRAPAAPPANDRTPDRRLRLGLLSASLRTHPVGWLTVAAFEALDPRQFDLVCFGQAPSSDAIQRRFAAIASAWHAVDGMPHAAIADLVRAAGIDVLIDLGGYGDMGLLPVCAQRAAPVQIKWVGAQAHSTGLAEMDWFITDRWETPPDLAHHYSERLLVMPDGYVCYSPPAYAPDVAALPALAAGHVTFGCFNNLSKITPDVIAAWARILRRVPGARLLLKGHQFGDAPTAARLQDSFASHGLAPGRVELRGSSPHRGLLAQYGEVDIVLDPFPYTGGLTTCEALWMGVPTICMAGETFAARHSTSHMSNVGLPDWVAQDIAGYEALAVAKAGALAALREGLRARVKASPLCDAPRFGARLGAALRRAWQAWCASP
jgi:predicted O-linked N-acetylglucosamine transferase (SPINDLY family)